MGSQGLPRAGTPLALVGPLTQQVVSGQLADLPTVLQAGILRHQVRQLVQVVPFIVQTGVQTHCPRLSRATGGGRGTEMGVVW